MRTAKLILVPSTLLFLVFLLNTEIKSIPALGKFLSPYTGFWCNAEEVGKKRKATLKFPELKGEVKVVYDDRSVPHIFAENDEDAAFAQGYIEAKDRLWQMDFQTRFAAGRLSEILGERPLEIDKRMRRKGLAYGAWKTNEQWKNYPVAYSFALAYCEGANAYIQNLAPKDYPVEFKLLGYEPEEWSPYKMALLTKLMADDLANRGYDLEMSNALAVFGREVFDFLFPEYFPDQTPIIPKETPWNFVPKQLRAN